MNGKMTSMLGMFSSALGKMTEAIERVGGAQSSPAARQTEESSLPGIGPEAPESGVSAQLAELSAELRRIREENAMLKRLIAEDEADGGAVPAFDDGAAEPADSAFPLFEDAAADSPLPDFDDEDAAMDAAIAALMEQEEAPPSGGAEFTDLGDFQLPEDAAEPGGDMPPEIEDSAAGDGDLFDIEAFLDESVAWAQSLTLVDRMRRDGVASRVVSFAELSEYLDRRDGRSA